MQEEDCACRKSPPAFRFKPTDKEICSDYLSAKLHGMPLPCEHSIAGEVDLYSALPWEVIREDDPHWLITELPFDKDPSKDKIKKTIFVFTKLYDMATKSDEKGRNKTRTAGSGTWKIQENKPVMDHGRMIGSNKYLGFYTGEKKRKSNQDSWSMHEYTLEGDDEKFKNYALCKVTVVRKQPTSEAEVEDRNHQVNVRLPVDSHVCNQRLEQLNMGPASVKAATGSNLQAYGYLNYGQRQSMGYDCYNQEVFNIHNYQRNSNALVITDGQYLGGVKHPQYVHVTDHEVHHRQLSFITEPAASSLDSNNVPYNISSTKAVLEENSQTVDDFLNQDPQVPFNLERENNQVGYEVVQELPVVEVNDQRNCLQDGDQEEVNPQVQETNVHDCMPSTDRKFGADNWSSEFSESDYMSLFDCSEPLLFP